MVTKTQYLDPVQFGRWVSERRRALGWPSQRSLAEAAEHDPVTRESGITESFLARLEAGVLAWPPRGGVRRRIVELAWFLCDTPRAVNAYLHLAACTRPTDDERALTARIITYISASTANVPILLPPRPPRLIGRAGELSALFEQLMALDGGCCAVTGTVGVGKSALAAEAVHLLARDRRRRAYYFPNGIISLSARHRHGLSGLLEVLSEICAVCSRDVDTLDTKSNARWRPRLVSSARVETDAGHEDAGKGVQSGHADASASELAAAINRTRIALADKRLLLLLDDLDPRFPLAQALDTLLGSGSLCGDQGEHGPRRGITVLVTGRAVIDSPLVSAKLHLSSLDESSSSALFADLVGYPLDGHERAAAARLCAGLAHLPLAIELAASAVRIDGIPIALLARLIDQRPLDLAWHGSEILRQQLADAVAALRPEARTTLALLPLIESHTFTLQAVAALTAGGALREMHPGQPSPQDMATGDRGIPHRVACEGKMRSDVDQDASQSTPLAEVDDSVPHTVLSDEADGDEADGDETEALACTAAALGQLVRSSLLDVVSPSVGASATAHGNLLPAPEDRHPRYHISPLLHAYALDELSALDPEQRERAYRNLHAYALDVVECLSATPKLLRHEWPVVMAAFTRSLRAGHEQHVRDLVSAVSTRPLLMLRFQDHTRFILEAGITAYRRANDLPALVRVLSCEGVFNYYQGSLDSAQRAWFESAHVAETLPVTCGLNAAKFNLAVLSMHVGDYGAALDFVEEFMASAATFGHSGDLAYAYSARAEVFHRQGAIDRALTDLSLAEERLVECGSGDPWGESWRESMIQHVRLERARVLGQYAQARDLVNVLARPNELTIAAAQIALDQAEYAARAGIVDDARTFALRAEQLGKDLRAGFFLANAQSLLERLGECQADEG